MDTGYDLIGQTMIVTMDKELDHHNAERIRETADKYIYLNKIKNLIFDFEDTDFMDSSGIGVIMGRYRLVSPLGGRVYVVNVNDVIDRILTLSGMYKIISKYSGLEEAITEINGKEA